MEIDENGCWCGGYRGWAGREGSDQVESGGVNDGQGSRKAEHGVSRGGLR